MISSYRARLSDRSCLYLNDRDDHEAAQRATAFARANNVNLIDIQIMKSYYPNSIDVVMALPDEIIPTPFYSEVIDEWSSGWSLPSEYTCIIRATTNNKVSEYAYRSYYHATNRIESLTKTADELLIITDEHLHYITSDA